MKQKTLNEILQRRQRGETQTAVAAALGITVNAVAGAVYRHRAVQARARVPVLEAEVTRLTAERDRMRAAIIDAWTYAFNNDANDRTVNLILGRLDPFIEQISGEDQ